MSRAFAVAAACAILISCRRPLPVPPHSAGPPRVLATAELTEAERRYGHSASRSDSVTLQPDVVVPPAGAKAIRSLSPNGLVWTIDPAADGADDIQPGKVLLLTSRAAGRVLAVNKSNDGLQVVLGPVAITEIIRDGEFAFDQPVDIGHALQMATPEAFDPAMPADPLIARAAIPNSFGVIRPVAFAPANQTTTHRFTLTPIVGTGVIGVRIVSKAGGVMFLGETALDLSAPRVDFRFKVANGNIVTSKVELSGVAGFLVKFEAALPSPTEANINERRFATSDLFIPVGGVGGVPLAVNVRQQIDLKTAFTSTGTLKAHAYYNLKGTLSAGYENGRWGVGIPSGLGARETLLPSINGVAIGVTGMVITHQVKVIVGVGAFGFVTGPYAFLNSNVTAARGSSIGFDAGHGVLGHGQVCRRETVNMGVGAGIGYQIPDPVTNVINAILRALRIKEIEGQGGVETKAKVLVTNGWYHPQGLSCGP